MHASWSVYVCACLQADTLDSMLTAALQSEWLAHVLTSQMRLPPRYVCTTTFACRPSFTDSTQTLASDSGSPHCYWTA